MQIKGSDGRPGYLPDLRPMGPNTDIRQPPQPKARPASACCGGSCATKTAPAGAVFISALRGHAVRVNKPWAYSSSR
ncbi:hypothetical protein H2136_12420 [Aeromonas hydrophila]|uniref:Uncharacterized protein n=1 Tax=Aeromonas hydrophila TaxID=644 RepID=A0A926FNN5_AERHY|nr:hypothetical protein [Aeromonas hydrophila]